MRRIAARLDVEGATEDVAALSMAAGIIPALSNNYEDNTLEGEVHNN